MLDKTLTFVLVGIIALIGNWIGFDVSPIEALLGMLIIMVISILGLIIDKVLPFHLPIVVWVSVIAILITSPIFPGNAFFVEETSKVNFMALATPILAYAGLSFGKDIQEFKKLGWRIVVVSLVVYTGTFLLATLVAELGFRFTGKFE